MQNVDAGNEPRYYPAEMGYLPPEFIEKAEWKLSENAEVRTAGLEEMRNLIQSEPLLVSEWFSDEDLVMFLRQKRFNVQMAFAALKESIKIVKKYADHFEPIDPSVVDKIWNENIFRIFPYRDKDGCVIIYGQLRAWDPGEISIRKLLVYVNLISWYAVRDPMTQVCGAKIIYDYKAPARKYLTSLTPSALNMCFRLCLDCVPLIKHAAHFMNPSSIMSMILPAIFAFLPESFRKGIFVHKDTEDILNHMDASFVPVEYGGQLKLDDSQRDLSSKIQWPDFVVKALESVKKKK